MKYGNDMEKLGDNRFKVELEQFRDRKEAGNSDFEVKNELVRDKEEYADDEFEVESERLPEADDEFEVKVEKKYPLYPDIKHYNESFRIRGGYRLEWPNKECKYFMMGGMTLGFIIGIMIDMLIDGKTHIGGLGGFIGLLVGYAANVIYHSREVADDDEEEDDDKYDKLWK
jgi:hypothetical protein